MSATSSADTALAEAAALAGTTSAQLGYQLTKQAFKESSAVTIFPLLLLELTAIAEGLAAYAATDTAWVLACAQIKTAAAQAKSRWS